MTKASMHTPPDQQATWEDRVRELLKRQAEIAESAKQLAQYHRQLVTSDHLEWLATKQEALAQALSELVDELRPRLEGTAFDKLRSLALQQTELSQAARALAAVRPEMERTLQQQSVAFQESEELSRNLRKELIRRDVNRLEKAVQDVLAEGKLGEEALREMFDLSKPD